jgi:hypothetical protein
MYYSENSSSCQLNANASSNVSSNTVQKTTYFLHQHGRDESGRKSLFSFQSPFNIQKEDIHFSGGLPSYFLPHLLLRWPGAHWNQNGGIQTYIVSLHQTIKTGKWPGKNLPTLHYSAIATLIQTCGTMHPTRKMEKKSVQQARMGNVVRQQQNTPHQFHRPP